MEPKAIEPSYKSMTAEAPAPKWWQSPLAKEIARIALAAALAFLASKGIHLPGEMAQPVNVYVSPASK